MLIVSQNAKVTTAKVWGGQNSEVSLGSQEDLHLTLPRSEFKNIKANYKFKNNIQAPIEIGQIIGTIEFTSNDRVVLSAPLVAIESVEAKGFFGRLIARLIYWITNLFSFS